MRHRTGFTLVEVLLTLAITGILMVAAVTATVRLRRAHRQTRAAHRRSTPHEPLRALLAADLLHATEYRALERGFALRGRASLRPGSLELQHIEAEIRYELREVGGSRWLVRTQRTGAEEPSAELVCGGVAAARLAAEGKDAPEGHDWEEIPDDVAAVIEWQADGRAPFRMEVATR